MLVNNSKSSTFIDSSIWCIVFPTKPNSITLHISLIKRASDVPPLVESSGFNHVLILIDSSTIFIKSSSSVKKGSPLNSLSNCHLKRLLS